MRRLREAVVDSGLARDDALWSAMPGGRTSEVWRVRSGSDDLVCRYRFESRDNPLFPSLPADETRCLEWLAGTGLAPELLGTVEVDGGVALICEYVHGEPWNLSGSMANRERQIGEVARFLDQVHALRPFPGAEARPSGSSELRQHSRDMLSTCSGELVVRIRQSEPRCDVVSDGDQTLTHGDVVPGNLIRARDRLVLIDWQCPGFGDPADDIACFLSPGMQMTNGGAIIDPHLVETFLDAYPCKKTIDRYRQLRPLFGWRMAAYCLWRIQHGGGDHREYQQAMEAEIAAIA